MIPKEYMSLLEREGYPLTNIGIKEIALNKPSAIKAIEILSKTSIGILGGDVYIIVNGKIEITYDNWYCNEKTFNNYFEFLRESCAIAKAYIRRYKESDVGTVLFTLVLNDGKPRVE